MIIVRREIALYIYIYVFFIIVNICSNKVDVCESE